MDSILERERAYRRRLAASLALTAVLQLLAWWLLPSPIGRPLRILPSAGGGAGGGLSLYDVRLPRAQPGGSSATATRPEAPTRAPTVDAPTAPADVEVTSKPAAAAATTAASLPAPAAVEGPSSAASDAGTGEAVGAGGPGSTGDAGSGSSGEGPGEAGDGGPQVLHPQVWVHPEMPQRVLVKRKIDDFVLLQVLVGADGRVHDVRTLRDIPNCQECTRNAVDAAWRLTFDPPVVPADAPGVWSQIFNFRFSYR